MVVDGFCAGDDFFVLSAPGAASFVVLAALPPATSEERAAGFATVLAARCFGALEMAPGRAGCTGTRATGALGGGGRTAGASEAVEDCAPSPVARPAASGSAGDGLRT